MPVRDSEGDGPADACSSVLGGVCQFWKCGEACEKCALPMVCRDRSSNDGGKPENTFNGALSRLLRHFDAHQFAEPRHCRITTVFNVIHKALELRLFVRPSDKLIDRRLHHGVSDLGSRGFAFHSSGQSVIDVGLEGWVCGNNLCHNVSAHFLVCAKQIGELLRKTCKKVGHILRQHAALGDNALRKLNILRSSISVRRLLSKVATIEHTLSKQSRCQARAVTCVLKSLLNHATHRLDLGVARLDNGRIVLHVA
mmetsp:Transcript_17247/g.44935  ORF Transcript_17247/g.44935 Transcript_17247/m.44935 type:complete len:254 (-) Transcript_17247:1672-2433(-)